MREHIKYHEFGTKYKKVIFMNQKKCFQTKNPMFKDGLWTKNL